MLFVKPIYLNSLNKHHDSHSQVHNDDDDYQKAENVSINYYDRDTVVGQVVEDSHKPPQQ
jgi:hypothetical protein